MYGFGINDLGSKKLNDVLGAINIKEVRIFYFNFIHDDRAIVRVFPMEDYAKIDPDIKMKEYKYGIIYIRSKDEFQMQDINTAFDYIPDETND
jgi:hypothetical protein